MDTQEAREHAKIVLDGIERTLDLCRVPEHEKREILQMVITYGDYLTSADDDDDWADNQQAQAGHAVWAC